MTLVVVPFHDGKSRLSPVRHVRRTLGLAMLTDVVAACVEVGATIVVTDDDEGAAAARELGASVVADPGAGQAAAVAAALAGHEDKAVLVVNADLPAVSAADLRTLVAATPAEGLALVEARDGTTNALSLAAAPLFAPLYGPGSASRFLAHTVSATRVSIPSIRDDVDTLDDLGRLRERLGSRTRAALAELEQGAVA